MRHLATIVILALGCVCAPLSSLSVADSVIDIADGSFAAIAYSPATGKYAYAYGYGSRWSAERAALERCRPDDARIVAWVNNGFCALALGDDVGSWGIGYSFGDGASNTYAKARALDECAKRTTGAHVVLWLTSDGQMIYER